MITPMSKLEILILREDLEKAIVVLHNLGFLHVEALSITSLMKQRGIARINLDPEQEKKKAQLEDLIKETDELMCALAHLYHTCLTDTVKGRQPPPARTPKASTLTCGMEPRAGTATDTTGKPVAFSAVKAGRELEPKSIQELTDVICNKLKPQLISITREINILKDELEILPRYKKILEAFSLSKREIKIHKNLACLALIVDRRYEYDMEIFKRKLEDKTQTKLEIYISPLDAKKIVTLLFYSPQIARQIDEEIFGGTIKIELPNKYLSQSLPAALVSIEGQLKVIPQQIEKLNETLFKFAKENLSVICAAKTVALNRLEETMIRSNFLESRYTAAITGWLPKKDLNRLNQVLGQSLGRNFVVYDRTSFVKQTQEIPVLLDNPRIARPYELLLGLLPLPKYGTKDATRLISLFFPLFFGLIVGDIGYGLIFLTISLCLKKSIKIFIRSISSILCAVSLSTIFFGVLYGEFLGNLGKHYLKLPHILFDRHESIVPFLILALSVGAFHVVLGFLLGITESLRNRHNKEVFEKVSILAGLIGLFLLVGALMNVLPSGYLPPSIVLLVIVSVLLVIVKGFIGPLEMISAVANILSYARLMALGVSGVMMASIANHIGGLPENIVIGIIMATLLHAVNLVLSIFSPTIQSLRLNYVEFFSKFYEPGGKRYNPFRKKEVAECIL